VAYTAVQIATAVKSAGVNQAYTHTHIGIPTGDHAIAVATALSMQNKGLADSQGLWGQPQTAGHPLGEQAIDLAMAMLDKNNWTWNKVPTFRDGSYQLFLPQAVAALASAPVNPKGTLQEPEPLNQGAGLEDLIREAVTVARDVTDPLFWRQVIFIGAGWVLIAVAVFQVLNKGLVQPVLSGAEQVDQIAGAAAGIKTNVVTPFRAYRKRQKATAAARATARGTKLIGGERPPERARKRPLVGTFNPNAPYVPPVKRTKPPPAKASSS
jgi:hypothetical protein